MLCNYACRVNESHILPVTLLRKDVISLGIYQRFTGILALKLYKHIMLSHAKKMTKKTNECHTVSASSVNQELNLSDIFF